MQPALNLRCKVKNNIKEKVQPSYPLRNAFLQGADTDTLISQVAKICQNSQKPHCFWWGHQSQYNRPLRSGHSHSMHSRVASPGISTICGRLSSTTANKGTSDNRCDPEHSDLECSAELSAAVVLYWADRTSACCQANSSFICRLVPGKAADRPGYAEAHRRRLPFVQAGLLVLIELVQARATCAISAGFKTLKLSRTAGVGHSCPTMLFARALARHGGSLCLRSRLHAQQGLAEE